LKELHQRLSTKGSNRAKVAVARRLLTIASLRSRQHVVATCRSHHRCAFRLPPAT
jgi:hypothetical protein